jgi:hypothetical protein
MSIETEVTVVDYLGYLMFRHDSEMTYQKKEVTHTICKECGLIFAMYEGSLKDRLSSFGASETFDKNVIHVRVQKSYVNN